MQHAHRRVLDHAGHDDADAFAGVDLRVLGEQRLDARGERRRPAPSDRARSGSEIDAGRAACRAGRRASGRSRWRGCRRRRRRGGASRCRGTSACGRARSRRSRLRRSACASSRSLTISVTAPRRTPIVAGEVGARDRLVRADQVQHDAAVDLAAGAAGGDPEAGGVDAAHLLNVATKAGAPNRDIHALSRLDRWNAAMVNEAVCLIKIQKGRQRPLDQCRARGADGAPTSRPSRRSTSR